MAGKGNHNLGHWSERAKKALNDLPKVTSDLIEAKALLQQADSALKAARKANAGLLVEVANLRKKLESAEVNERALKLEIEQSNSAMAALASVADVRRARRWPLMGFLGRFYR